MNLTICISMGIGDWGLGIGDWGLGPIPNPQSPIPNPHYHQNIAPSKFIKDLGLLFKICRIIVKINKNYLNEIYKEPQTQLTSRRDPLRCLYISNNPFYKNNNKK